MSRDGAGEVAALAERVDALEVRVTDHDNVNDDRHRRAACRIAALEASVARHGERIEELALAVGVDVSGLDAAVRRLVDALVNDVMDGGGGLDSSAGDEVLAALDGPATDPAPDAGGEVRQMVYTRADGSKWVHDENEECARSCCYPADHRRNSTPPAAPLPTGELPGDLYVVCDGLPGPRSCHFVELEDGDGRSHGQDVGVEWSEHPNAPGLYRLGPFARTLPPALGDEAREVVEWAAQLPCSNHGGEGACLSCLYCRARKALASDRLRALAGPPP